MKRGAKLALLGAAAAAVGVLLYKRYQDSYEEIPAEEVESDFVETEQPEEDISCIVEEDEALYEE